MSTKVLTATAPTRIGPGHCHLRMSTPVADIIRNRIDMSTATSSHTLLSDPHFPRLQCYPVAQLPTPVLPPMSNTVRRTCLISSTRNMAPPLFIRWLAACPRRASIQVFPTTGLHLLNSIRWGSNAWKHNLSGPCSSIPIVSCKDKDTQRRNSPWSVSRGFHIIR